MKKTEESLNVGPLLQQILNRHPAFFSNPFGDWSEVAGEQVAKNSRPASLKKKSLLIIVLDSVWKHHLELCKEDLLKKINKGRPEPLVEKIVIRVGELPEAEPALNPDHKLLKKIKPKKYRPVKKKPATKYPLTPHEKALLKSISDPELREACARLLKITVPEPQEDS